MTTEWEKINCMFANAMFDIYVKSRFGLKSCRLRTDEFLLNDIREMYNRANQTTECGLCPDCSEVVIEEFINTI